MNHMGAPSGFPLYIKAELLVHVSVCDPGRRGEF